jgi:hypothetical protein
MNMRTILISVNEIENYSQLCDRASNVTPIIFLLFGQINVAERRHPA